MLASPSTSMSTTRMHLPVETFTRIFSSAGLSGICTASHVCARWRAIAFDHPDYWSYIVIKDVRAGYLARVRHRVESGGSRALAHFEIDYRKAHDHDDPVLKVLLPLLRAAVPRAKDLTITIESMYRLHVEDTLCKAAPHLRALSLFYASGPHPDLHLSMPLGNKKVLLGGGPGVLRSVHLYHVVLPRVVIQAFCNVEEVYWIHAVSTLQEEFPCYLFDFFPNMKRLRMTCGECWFTNAPLPPAICEMFSRLTWFDLEVRAVSVPAFFEHLPVHDLPDVTISGPEEDGIYLTLEPLTSFFDIALTQTSPFEFLITVRSRHTPRIRRFAEPLRYYYADSPYTNELMLNGGFMDQVATLLIEASLWTRLKPWMLSTMDALPTLIIVLNEDTPFPVSLPPDPWSCPSLRTLVLQAKYNHAYVSAEELISFADRLTTACVVLELRRVLIDGSSELLNSRFSLVEYSLARYPAD